MTSEHITNKNVTRQFKQLTNNSIRFIPMPMLFAAMGKLAYFLNVKLPENVTRDQYYRILQIKKIHLIRAYLMDWCIKLLKKKIKIFILVLAQQKMLLRTLFMS
jgi:hypothetical protein